MRTHASSMRTHTHSKNPKPETQNRKRRKHNRKRKSNNLSCFKHKHENKPKLNKHIKAIKTCI